MLGHALTPFRCSNLKRTIPNVAVFTSSAWRGLAPEDHHLHHGVSLAGGPPHHLPPAGHSPEAPL